MYIKYEGLVLDGQHGRLEVQWEHCAVRLGSQPTQEQGPCRRVRDHKGTKGKGNHPGQGVDNVRAEWNKHEGWVDKEDANDDAHQDTQPGDLVLEQDHTKR